MKKLIIILFMFSFVVSGQIQTSENWQFKQDKKLHAISGVVISIPSYYLMLNATNDLQVSRNAAWMVPTFAAMGKEFADGMQGKNISFADISYTLAGAIITTIIMTQITKRRIRRNKQLIEF